VLKKVCKVPLFLDLEVISSLLILLFLFLMQPV